jgi:hypothetical protein
MNDRNSNQGQDNPGTGAGSRQHEQQTEGDRQRGQMEQQGGVPGSPDDAADSSSPGERRAGESTPGGLGQSEQQASGDAMQPGSDIRAGQQEQRQGGSYRAEGDRGVAFEPDQGNDITFDEDGQLESQLQQEESPSRQQQQQGGAAPQPDERGRDADDAGSDSEER